jgi:hypothetical protein
MLEMGSIHENKDRKHLGLVFTDHINFSVKTNSSPFICIIPTYLDYLSVKTKLLRENLSFDFFHYRGIENQKKS